MPLTCQKISIFLSFHTSLQLLQYLYCEQSYHLSNSVYIFLRPCISRCRARSSKVIIFVVLLPFEKEFINGYEFVDEILSLPYDAVANITLTTFADYQHAKRIWKCAVEHHTFFRLIQPDEKPKSSLFRWGSARFRYQGRTQFQTKMASQMFDKPNTVAVQRASSARLTHSLDNGTFWSVLAVQTRRSARRAAVSSTISITIHKAGTATNHSLVYTPVESPTSAAYYISERSSACSPSSNEFNRSQISRTPLYSWKMSESGGGTASASHAGAASPTGGDAAGRYSYHNEPSSSYSLPNRSSPFASSSIDSTEKRPDIEQIPIDGAVQVYHEGHYYRLENQPRAHHVQQRYYNAQRNGVPSVRRLGPDQEMDPHPIRYFVNVHHSGSSHIPRVSRDRHPGREEVGAADPSNYIFRMDPATPVQRLEPHGELPSHNIRQYSSVYHHGSSLLPNAKQTDENAPPVPPPRLIARVLPSPLVKAQAQTAADGSSAAVIEGKKQKDLNESKDSSKIRSTLKTRQLENGEAEVAAQKHTATESTSHHVSSRTVTSHDITPQKPGRTQQKQTNLFGRKRHEGEEDTIEKERVRPETYGVTSAASTAPLDSTTRSSELASVPLQQHAQAYHHGQSWDDGKAMKLSTGTGVLHLKTTPVKRSKSPTTDGETKKLRLIARVPKKSTEDEADTTKPKKGQDSPGRLAFWKSGGRKHRGDSHEGANGYPTTDKYQGPLEDVNRQKDIDLIPITSPKSVPYKPAPADAVSRPNGQQTHLFGRWRHDGEEETVEKSQVRPESYGVASTSYDGPLDSTTRNSDLPSVPLQEHAKAYHAGQSWHASKDVNTGNAAVQHMKSPVKEKSSPTSDDETRKVRLIARVPPKTPEGDASTAATAGYPVTEKYQGPLEDVDRQKDISTIPLTSPQSVTYKLTSADTPPHRDGKSIHLFGRWRHDGDEDTVEKDHVRPETYGIKTTSYEGPLENTPLNSDLPSAPLREYAQVYHHGQSWDHGKAAKFSTAVLHLKSTHTKDKPSPSSEEDTKKVRLIARVPAKAPEDTGTAKPKKDHDSSRGLTFWKFGNRKRHGESHEVDIDMIPLTSPKSVPYKPASATAPQPSDGPRSHIFGRWRHDGDEDTVEKGQVRPETYGIKTTSYEGPLDSTTLSSDLPSVPLREHAQVYHHGQSWNDDRAVKVSTAVLHLKSTQTKDKPSPSSEEETRKVRLIARIPPKASEDESDRSRPKKDHDHEHSSSGLPFWKFGSRKRHGESNEVGAEYPITDKYQGPMESVNPQKDIDMIPVTPSKSVPYKPASAGAPQPSHGPKSRLFGRWRHEGDEDTVEKDQTTSYEGPLESTTRYSDLPSVPLRGHAEVYHHGQSWDDDRGMKGSAGTSIESDRNTGKTADKPSPSPEEETKKVRLIARIPPKASEDESDTSRAKKDHDSSSGLSFWKFGNRKRHGESHEVGAEYPITDKYQGPLESVNPQKDIDMIPLTPSKSVPYKPASAGAPQHTDGTSSRLFGRWRHDGDEDIVEKDQVRPETYGIKTTTYEGPLDSTNRSSDLPSVPLREHAQAYHHGQSDRNTGKTAVLHLKSTHTKDKPSPSFEEETRKVRLIARIPPKASEDEADKVKPKKDHDPSGGLAFWKLGNRKRHGDLHEGTSGYPSSEKYQGPLEDVNRQRDIDVIPFTSPKSVPYKPASGDTQEHYDGQRIHLFGRWRHDGDEDIIEKDQVRPETYGIKTTSYEGPLETTALNSELPSVPLREHAQAYHHGQSWEDVATSSPIESGSNIGKTAVLHLKSAHRKDKPSPLPEDETKKVRLIARIPPKAEESEVDTTRPKKDDPSGGFTFWKFGNRKRHGGLHEGTSGYPSSETYQGPLEDVNRQRDIDLIPFTSPKSVPYKPASADAQQQYSERRAHLFGRWRHDGNEDIIEKDQVRPETYGIKTTTYEGPLDSTTRSTDLPSVPLREHAQAYHHGQSWNDDKAVNVSATAPTETGKTAVLHLKSTHTKDKPSPSSEDETKKVRLIARIPPKAEEGEVDTTRPKKGDSSGGLTFWKFGKHRGDSHEDGAQYPTTEKYQGTLESVNPQKDIDVIPFTSPKSVPYKPASIGAPQQFGGQRSHLFGRWRHDGDEDIVEKDHVRPETYGIKTTTYEGPLDSTTRSSDLPSVPLREHAQAYHHGQSWNDDKAVNVSAAAPTETGKITSSDDETRKVRLIARIPPKAEEGEVDKTRPKKDDSSGGLTFWKFGNRKRHGGLYEGTSGYPSSDTYQGPLEDVNRQRDIDLIPFTSPKSVPYKPASIGAPQQSGGQRAHLFGRWRHGGDEDIIEKDQVRPETYGIKTTTYEGPLDSTTRSTDLPSVPLREHAEAYHHGQSWNGDKAVNVSPSLSSDEETRKVRLIARVPAENPDDGTDTVKALPDHDSSGKFAFWKLGYRGGSHETAASYPTTEKYLGPLEDVNRQKDIDLIPFTSPTPAPYKAAPVAASESTGRHRTNLFGRLRHGADEGTKEKDRLRPETRGQSYDQEKLVKEPAAHVLRKTSEDESVKKDEDSSGRLASLKSPGKAELSLGGTTAHPSALKYQSPLEDVSREKDIDQIPFTAPAPVPYKPASTVAAGEGTHLFGRWRHGGDEETVEKDLTTAYEGPLDSTTHSSDLPTVPLRDHAQAYHVGQSWKDGKDDKDSTDIPAEADRGTIRTAKSSTKPGDETKKEELVTHESALWKSGDKEATNDPLECRTVHPNAYKHKSPLEDVNREKEIDLIPFTSPTPVPYKPAATSTTEQSGEKRTNLFGRWRRSGDNETADKAQVRPEMHGVASTSFDGPLESSTRSSELPSVPLQEHAQVYHHGQSWDDGAPQLKRKSTPATEEEAGKVRLVARIPRRSSEDNADAAKTKKDKGSSGKFAFWKSGNHLDQMVPFQIDTGATTDVQQRLEGDGKNTTARPSSEKFDVTLQELDRQKDLDGTVPLKTASGSIVEDAQQRSEGDGKKSEHDTDAAKSKKDQGFTGKFAFWKSGNRKEGKDGGDSIDATTARPSSGKHDTALEGLDRQKDLDQMVPYEIDAGATTSVQQRLEGDGKKPSEDDADVVKPKKDQGFTGKLAFWKSGNRKDGGDSSDGTTARPSSDKHDTTLVRLDRQKDLDQVVPYRDALDSGVERTQLQSEGDVKRLSEDDADQAKSRQDQGFAGKFAFWKSGNRKDGGDLIEGTTARPSSDKHDTTLEGLDRQKLLDQAPSYKIASGSAVEYIQRRDEGGEKDRMLSGAHGVASTSSGERRPESTTPHSDLPRGKQACLYLSEESPGRLGSYSEKDQLPSSGLWTRTRTTTADTSRPHVGGPSYTIERTSFVTGDSENLVAASSSHAGRTEGRTMHGDEYVEVRVDRRVEVQLEPMYCLSGAGLGALAENDDGMVFSVTPPMLSSSSTDRSFFSRFGFKVRSSLFLAHHN
ncbi:unnamed protein product [Heligmosomoides polygyrus]|uniref:FA domain-containing protein n=1 Tax=Heligmosomoides polygyrus TaxID=6339 RepID=A0A3P7ZPY1_HELPZ|nr:unnamed protein product [Heligmosomoides polygyrus]